MIVRLRIARFETPDVRKRNRFPADETVPLAPSTVIEIPWGNASGKVTITSYLNDISAVFPSFVFATAKLYAAAVIPCPQSIVRLSEELPRKSTINDETCALSPPLEEESFFAKETPLDVIRRVAKRKISAKANPAPFLLFVAPFLNIFYSVNAVRCFGISDRNFCLVRKKYYYLLSEDTEFVFPRRFSPIAIIKIKS